MQRIKFFLTAIISFGAGIVITIFLKKWSALYISNEVSIKLNPFEIISIGVTVLLAIYITRKLSKDNDIDKSQKELLISYFDDFKNEASIKVSNILKKNAFNKTETKSALKILRKRLKSIIELADDYSFIEKNSDLTKKTKEKLTDIWEILTDTPKRGADQTLIEEKKQAVEKNMIEIYELIFKITFEINKK